VPIGCVSVAFAMNIKNAGDARSRLVLALRSLEAAIATEPPSPDAGGPAAVTGAAEEMGVTQVQARRSVASVARRDKVAEHGRRGRASSSEEDGDHDESSDDKSSDAAGGKIGQGEGRGEGRGQGRGRRQGRGRQGRGRWAAPLPALLWNTALGPKTQQVITEPQDVRGAPAGPFYPLPRT